MKHIYVFGQGNVTLQF